MNLWFFLLNLRLLLCWLRLLFGLFNMYFFFRKAWIFFLLNLCIFLHWNLFWLFNFRFTLSFILDCNWFWFGFLFDLRFGFFFKLIEILLDYLFFVTAIFLLLYFLFRLKLLYLFWFWHLCVPFANLTCFFLVYFILSLMLGALNLLYFCIDLIWFSCMTD